MENGERKKLSSTSLDEDQKEDSPYRLCSTFAVSLTQRSRHRHGDRGGSPDFAAPWGPGASEDCENEKVLVLGRETVLVVEGKALYPSGFLPFRRGSRSLANT